MIQTAAFSWIYNNILHYPFIEILKYYRNPFFEKTKEEEGRFIESRCRFIKDIPTCIMQSYQNAYGVRDQYRFTFLLRL